MPEQRKTTPGLSLDAPPVYRRFLAGGPEVLRLSASGMWLIIGLGVLVSVTVMTFTESCRPGWGLSSGTAATIAALATAAVAARWLGSRVGLVSGCLYLLSGRIFLETGSTGEHWFSAMAVAAVGVFALGNVAGRLPPAAGRWPAVVFYGLVAAMCIFIGPMAAGGVVSTCVVLAIVGQSGRGMRFLIDWRGLATLAAVVAIAASTAWPWPQWPKMYVFSAGAWPDLAAGLRHLLLVDIPIDLLPWGPLALVAIVVGIRQGHHGTPFGRLLSVWAVAPLVLTPLGLLDRATAAALVFAPLTILCGLGLCEILPKTACRRRGARATRRE